MQISFHGPDTDSAADFGLALRQQGFQNPHPLVHRTRCDQHLRYKNFVVFELYPDYIQSGKQALFENLLCRDSFFYSLLNQFLRGLCSPCLHFSGNLL